MNRNKLWLLLALCALVLFVACGGGNKEEAAPAGGTQAAAPAAAPAGGAAPAAGPGSTVSGTATFAGTSTDTPIAMNADPVCAGLHKEPVTTGKVVVANGKLANVFVYVKSGLPAGATYPAPTAKAEINQQGCLYHPRIQGMMVNQGLVIKNSDPTLHNIHALPKTNQEFNQGQPFQNMQFEKTFTKPEVMVHFKCDVHPWMSAYIGVLDHPFFAVTKEDGSFSIPNLPPGKYTLEAWHEELGTQDQDITVAAGAPVTANFDFKPKS
jgi:Carboxypeptidase regulatory-like domain